MYTALLLPGSLLMHALSRLAGGRAIKAEAHLSFSLFAALHGYHKSAQENVSAHHHGGNCNVKPKTVGSQNKAHVICFRVGARR